MPCLHAVFGIVSVIFVIFAQTAKKMPQPTDPAFRAPPPAPAARGGPAGQADPGAGAPLPASVLLRHLENAAFGRRTHARGPGDWHGFAFRLARRGADESGVRQADEHLALPLQDGMEIASADRLCALPRCRGWVRGIAAMHGKIYTVIDLADFLGFGATDASRARLLLLPPQQDFYSALLLDKSVSLRVFEGGLPAAAREEAAQSVAPYLRAALREGARRWGVLDMDALLSSEQWRRVGQ